MTFRSTQQVRFAHVDGAGIVFYPRYFEMLNAAIEDYFAYGIGVDFAEMHGERGLGVPTVRLEADFAAPSRLGEALDFLVQPERVGRSSAEISVQVECGGELRFRATVVLVCMDLKGGRSVEWPADMRPQAMSVAA